VKFSNTTEISEVFCRLLKLLKYSYFSLFLIFLLSSCRFDFAGDRHVDCTSFAKE